MKVLLSWSGGRSKTLAAAFRAWLPEVIQLVEPWMSEADIDAGKAWQPELRGQLEQSSVGLLFVTPDNINGPWLLFEAGALAKSVEESRVCPLLFDGLQPEVLAGSPLAQFQAKRSDKEDIRAVVESINRALDTRALEPQLLQRAFERCWPELEKAIVTPVGSAAPATPKRVPEEILGEILSVVRRIDDQAARNAEIEVKSRLTEAAKAAVYKYVDERLDKELVAHALRIVADIGKERALAVADLFEGEALGHKSVGVRAEEIAAREMRIRELAEAAARLADEKKGSSGFGVAENAGVAA